MRTVTIEIKKPLYGNYVYINSTTIDRAINTGSMLEIIVPRGRAIVDPRKWKANGQVMRKVFKYPDHPMILYGGNVPIPSDSKGKVITPEVKMVEDKQAKLF